MQLALQFLPPFLLVLCRITSFFVVAPLFSFRTVPNPFKVGLGVFVSLLVVAALDGGANTVAFGTGYPLLVVREILVGLLLGFTVYLFFTVVQIAGAFIDQQIGFGMVNVVDPMTGAQSPLVGNFKFFVALLLFLALNGHHQLLLGLMRSYEWIPLHNALFLHIADGSIFDFLLESFVRAFYLAFQMAAPIVVSIFLVDVGLGVLARVAPQFNMFVVGLPTKITVGFIVLVLIVPGLLYLFRDLFAETIQALRRLLELVSAA